MDTKKGAIEGIPWFTKAQIPEAFGGLSKALSEATLWAIRDYERTGGDMTKAAIHSVEMEKDVVTVAIGGERRSAACLSSSHTQVRPGQVWRSEKHGYVLIIKERHRSNEGWTYTSGGWDTDWSFADGTLTFVSDAAEVAKNEPGLSSAAALKERLEIIRSRAFAEVGIDFGHASKTAVANFYGCMECGRLSSGTKCSAGCANTTAYQGSNLSREADIAAKMQAHNDAFQERHKEAIAAGLRADWTPSYGGNPSVRRYNQRGGR